MERLRAVLIERYADHYARVNSNIDSSSLSTKQIRSFDRMLTPLLRTLPAGSRVLDLGCGTGFLLSYLRRYPNLTLTGVDASTSQIEAAKRFLPGIDFQLSEGIPFLRNHSATFAGIFCTDVVEHLSTDDACLEWVEAATAALAPGGFFFCRVPNAANLFASYSRYMDITHARSFTRPSLLQLFEAAGLADCRPVHVRSGSLLGDTRHALESVLHKALMRLCGHAGEPIVTSNICMVGYRRS